MGTDAFNLLHHKPPIAQKNFNHLASHAGTERTRAVPDSGNGAKVSLANTTVVRMNKLRALLTMAVCMSITFSSTGCLAVSYLLFYPRHPQQWGYVFDEGGADDITRWTLRQVDDDRIQDGVAALCEIVSENDHEEHPGARQQREAARSIAGLRAIHDRLASGWPGYTGYNRYVAMSQPMIISPRERAENLEHQLQGMYYEFVGTFACRSLFSLYYQLRPDPVRNPTRYAAWAKMGLRSRPPLKDPLGN